MIKHIIATVALVGVVSSAFAADLPSAPNNMRRYQQAPAPVFTIFEPSPSGFYLVGGVAGYLGDRNAIAPNAGIGYQLGSRYRLVDGSQYEIKGKYSFFLGGSSYSYVTQQGSIGTCKPCGGKSLGSFENTLYGKRSNAPGIVFNAYTGQFGQKYGFGFVDGYRAGLEVDADFNEESNYVQGTYHVKGATINPVMLDQMKKSFVTVGVGPVLRADRGPLSVKVGYLFDVTGQKTGLGTSGTAYNVGSNKGRVVVGADYRFGLFGGGQTVTTRY